MKKSLITLSLFALLTALSAQNWQPMAAGLLPNNTVIFSISAIGENVVWAVASGEYYQGPIPSSVYPRVLRSIDGGQSWTVSGIEAAASTISFQIVAVDSLIAWITTQDYGGGAGRALYNTVDGGLNWTKILPEGAGGVALNRFADGQHWLAHNRQAISRSADNGSNWTSATVLGYQTGEYQILNSGANLSNTIGDTLWSGTSAGRILRFTDYGQSTQFFSTPLGSATTITSIAFQDHLNGLCYSQNISNNNRIARSTDGGGTWTLLTQQPGTTIGWNIAAVPGSPGFYVLASNYNFASGKVAITTNFGASWSVETVNQPLNAVAFTSSTTGWIGAGKITSSIQPALFKYAGSPLVATTMPDELPGFIVSPNPVSDVIYFDFEGCEGEETIIASLTDLQGHCVFTGKISDKKLNVSQLPVGTYIFKIETEQGFALRKIVRL